MPSYTYKMAIVSWPRILWRHFTLRIMNINREHNKQIGFQLPFETHRTAAAQRWRQTGKLFRFLKKHNRKRNFATSLTYYFSTRILLHTVHTDSSIIWLLVASATVNDQSVYLCIMYQMTSNNYKNTGAPKCLKMGHVTPTISPYYQYPTPSKFRVTWFEPFPTNKGSYCSTAASVATHGHRNRSGRPGGCRTNNLTTNFSVHIISTFVNVK